MEPYEPNADDFRSKCLGAFCLGFQGEMLPAAGEGGWGKEGEGEMLDGEG